MRAPLDKLRGKQPGEFEVPEMVGAELDFEAVGGPAQRCEHHPGVVHQHVDLGVRSCIAAAAVEHWPVW